MQLMFTSKSASSVIDSFRLSDFPSYEHIVSAESAPIFSAILANTILYLYVSLYQKCSNMKKA